MYNKAFQAFRDDYQRPDIFTPRDPHKEDDDELSIFSGRTRTVNTKAAVKLSPPLHRQASLQMSSSISSPTTTEVSSSSSSSLRASHSPTTGSPQTLDALPALQAYGGAVHPMLVDEMRNFESQLDAQISDAEKRYYLATISKASPDSRSNTSVYPHSSVESYPQYTDTQGDSQDQTWKWSQQEMPPPPPQPVAAHAQYQPVYEQQQGHHPASSNAYYQNHPSSDNAYSVHGYDAANSVSSMQPAHQSDYIPQAPPPVTTSYVLPPQAAHQEYWHQPVAATTEYAPHGSMVPDPHSHHYHTQMHSRQPTMYSQPTSYAPQVGSQVHGMQQMAHTAAAPPPLPPQPPQPPQPPMLPVNTGSYSLTEAWMSFVRHEMPAPPPLQSQPQPQQQQHQQLPPPQMQRYPRR